MRIHFVSIPIGVLWSISSILYIHLIRGQNALRHGSCSWRPIKFKRFLSPHDPRRKEYICNTECVVGMQMGNETDLEINRFQRFDTFVASCRSAPDDSGSKINQIWSTIDDDSRARACALRI